ncbi:protein phosphatase 2C domain-containing protein [Kitasatospora camelliae]|uniref:Protein phosphatase 2C domain-containing protein n=1 Tax=Kitasatospora camelliae TaxID=3156397 RepID=A0AAU8JS10_9ACTN
MSDLSDHGTPPQPHRPADGWWHAVYAGPAGTLPDTPDARPDTGTVDDWFAAAAGVVAPRHSPAGVRATAAEEPTAVPVSAGEPATAAGEPAVLVGEHATAAGSRAPEWPEPEAPVLAVQPEEVSVNDWFDSALGMIGPQRTGDPAAVEAPAPASAPAAEPVRAPERAGPSWRAGLPDPAPEAAPVSAPAAEAEDRTPATPPSAASQPEREPEPVSGEAPSGAGGASGAPQGTRSPWWTDTSPARGGAPVTPGPRKPRPAESPAADTARPDAPVPARTDPRRLPATGGGSPEETGPAPDRARPPRMSLEKPPVPAPGEPSAHEPAVPVEAAEAVPTAEPHPAAVPAAVPAPAPAPEPPAAEAGLPPLRRPRVEPPVPHVGERPPTYGPEPTAVPAGDPDLLGTVVADIVVEGAQYGSATLRAVSVRGDSARFRGEPRSDALLVTRFGEGEDGLLLAVLAGPGYREEAVTGSLAASEAARQLAAAIGRSRAELSTDLRSGARDRLRYGLQRLTARAAAPLRSEAARRRQTPAAPNTPEEDAGSLHCLLVSLDPEATHRAAFGTGPGGLYLLRSGHWIDAYAARLLHHPDGQPPLPPGPSAHAPRPFRFRMVPATPGDILLLCTPGLAEPVAEEPAVAHFLSNHWAHPHPPGTVDFLRQVQVRAKGYADDRTAAAIWTE